MPDKDLSQFLDLYVSEAEEILQKLNDDMLALEKDPQNKELFDSLMRNSHTIKGSSNTMGFKQIAELTHALEDIFDAARKEKVKIEKSNFDSILKGFDSLKNSIQTVKKTQQEPDLSDITDQIRSTISGAPEKLEQPPIQKTSETKQVTEAQEKISHVKVPIRRLDKLLNLTEELLVHKMQLEEVVDKTMQQLRLIETPEIELKLPYIQKLKPVSDKLNQLVSDLRYQVMESRLVPLEQVFNRFPRMIRDLSHEQGKEVDFQVKGGDIELDRTIVDRLGEPLVHILRNAVDHGIRQKGSITISATREKERILISIEDNGQGITWKEVIESAFKKGIISSENKSLWNEVLSSPEYQKHKDFYKIQQIIFHPQFSTNQSVTQVSGRGVGLSAVKEFASEIGGSINVESPIGKGGGTRFVLELPMSLAILNSLLVQVSDHVYAIPFANIERTARIKNESIKTIADEKVCILGERDIPLISLSKQFGQRSKNEKMEAAKTDELIVIVNKDKELVGLIVDQLLSEQEIVVKPLPPLLLKTKGFSGSTILGNGEVALIIDPASLMNINQNR